MTIPLVTNFKLFSYQGFLVDILSKEYSLVKYNHIWWYTQNKNPDF